MRKIPPLIHFFCLIVAVLVLTSPLMAQEEPAIACAASDFTGKWKNIRHEKKNLVMLEVVDNCIKPDIGAGVRVRAFELCLPRPCSWGWADQVIERDGTLQAAFQTFSAARRITATRQGARLEVSVETDFISEGRDDIRVRHILVLSNE